MRNNIILHKKFSLHLFLNIHSITSSLLNPPVQARATGGWESMNHWLPRQCEVGKGRNLGSETMGLSGGIRAPERKGGGTELEWKDISEDQKMKM